MADPLETGTVDTTTGDDPLLGKQTGQESSLSNWAGDYVTDMLGQGQALAGMDYEAYTGPLTADASDLQQNAFSGLAGLTIPSDQMGGFTANTFDATAAQNYMNPYLMSALNPQIEEARRQAEIQRIKDAGRLTKAGAFGGSRQAIMESEGNRNLLRNLGDITAKGYATAFDKATQQFNTEEDRRKAVQELNNLYGLSALRAQLESGATQRDIEQQGIDADIAQFEEERDFPYKQVQYMQSLLQGLPLAAQSYTYQGESDLNKILNLIGGGAGGLEDIIAIFGGLLGGDETTPTSTSTPTGTTPESDELDGIE